MFNVALDHMRCGVGKGGGKGRARTFIAPWEGVRVVQLGPAGLARRVAFGELSAPSAVEAKLAKVGLCCG